MNTTKLAEHTHEDGRKCSELSTNTGVGWYWREGPYVNSCDRAHTANKGA